MADSINTNEVPLTTPDYAGLMQRGYEQRAAQSGLRALQGIDLNNQNSIDQAMQGSIRAGQIDQAGALANLAFTRNIRAGANGWMDIIANAVTGQNGTPQAPTQQPRQTSANPLEQYALDHGGVVDHYPGASTPQAQPTQQPQPQAPQQFTPDQLDTATRTFGRIDAALNTLRGIPQDKRAAAVNQIVSQQLGGLPPEAVQAHVADLAKYGYSNEAIDGLKMYHQQALNNLTVYHQQPEQGDNAAAPAAPAAPTQPLQMHPATYNWGKNLINNPQALLAMSRLKMMGIDTSSLFEGAKLVAGPELAGETTTAQQRAELQFAQPKAALTAAGTFAGSPTDLTYAATGAKKHFMTGADAIAEYQNAPPGTFGEPSPAMMDAMKRQAVMPYTLTDIDKDGHKVPITEGQKYELLTGQPLPAPGQQPAQAPGGTDIRTRGAAPAGGVQGGGAAPPVGGAPGMALGTRAPEQQYMIDQAAQEVNKNATEDTRRDLEGKLNLYGDVIDLAQNKHVSGPAATFFGPLAQKLGPLLGQGVERYGDRYADLATRMAAIGKNNLVGVLGSSIRNQHEFDAAQRAGGVQPDPGESLALTTAQGYAAIHAKQLFNDFMGQYYANHGAMDKPSIEAAWRATPEGRADMRGDPIFTKIIVNGKPALMPIKGSPGWGIYAPGLYGNKFKVKVLPGTFE